MNLNQNYNNEYRVTENNMKSENVFIDNIDTITTFNIKNSLFYGSKQRDKYFNPKFDRTNYINDIDDPLFTGFTLSLDIINSPLFFGCKLGGNINVEEIKSRLNNSIDDNFNISLLNAKDKFNNGKYIGYGLQKNIYQDDLLYGAIDYIYMVDNIIDNVNYSTDDDIIAIRNAQDEYAVNKNKILSTDFEKYELNLLKNNLNEKCLKYIIYYSSANIESSPFYYVENEMYAGSDFYDFVMYLIKDGFHINSSTNMIMSYGNFDFFNSDFYDFDKKIFRDKILTIKDENIINDFLNNDGLPIIKNDSDNSNNETPDVGNDIVKFHKKTSGAKKTDKSYLRERDALMEEIQNLNDKYEKLKKDNEQLNNDVEKTNEDDITLPSMTPNTSISEENVMNETIEHNSVVPQTVIDMHNFLNDLYNISTEHPYMFKNITGLDEAYKNHYITKDGYLGSGDDKITISCYESIDLKISSAFNRYFNAVYDRQYRRERVPINLRRFNCSIFVHDIRNFKKSLNSIFKDKFKGKDDINKLITFAINNVSAIEFKFYDCEIDTENTGSIFKDVKNTEGGDMVETEFTFTYGNCVINFLPFKDLYDNFKDFSEEITRINTHKSYKDENNEELRELEEIREIGIIDDFKSTIGRINEIGNINDDDMFEYVPIYNKNNLNENNPLKENNILNFINNIIRSISASTGINTNEVYDILHINEVTHPHEHFTKYGYVGKINENDKPIDNTSYIGKVNGNNNIIAKVDDENIYSNINTSQLGITDNIQSDFNYNINHIGSTIVNDFDKDKEKLNFTEKTNGKLNDAGKINVNYNEKTNITSLGKEDYKINEKYIDKLGSVDSNIYEGENLKNVGFVDLEYTEKNKLKDAGNIDMSGNIIGETQEIGTLNSDIIEPNNLNNIGKLYNEIKPSKNITNLNKVYNKKEPNDKTIDLGKNDIQNNETKEVSLGKLTYNIKSTKIDDLGSVYNKTNNIKNITSIGNINNETNDNINNVKSIGKLNESKKPKDDYNNIGNINNDNTNEQNKVITKITE